VTTSLTLSGRGVVIPDSVWHMETRRVLPPGVFLGTVTIPSKLSYLRKFGGGGAIVTVPKKIPWG